jgi:hypothetical protein
MAPPSDGATGDATPKDTPKGQAVPGVDPTADAAALDTAMAAMRTDLRKNGSALATGSAAVLGAIGYTQLHQIFPAPANGWFTPVVAASIAAAAMGTSFLVSRVFAATRRILIGSDASARGLSHSERARALAVLTEHAREQQAQTLRALEYRALRLGRVAQRPEASSALSAAAKSESDRLYGVIYIALKRAAATILEERTRKALGGRLSAAAFLLAAAGVAGVFALADYSKGQRDLIDLRTKCATAEAQVPLACKAIVSSTAPSKPAPSAAARALACARAVDTAGGLTSTARTQLETACAAILTNAAGASGP